MLDDLVAYAGPLEGSTHERCSSSLRSSSSDSARVFVGPYEIEKSPRPPLRTTADDRVEHLELQLEGVLEEVADVLLVTPGERIADSRGWRSGLKRLHDAADVADAAVLGPAR